MNTLEQITKIFDKTNALGGKQLSVVARENISTGGGFEHDFFLLNNGLVLSIHYPFMDVEISYNKFKSIDEYIDTDFGYEGCYPDYPQRTFNLLGRLEG